MQHAHSKHKENLVSGTLHHIPEVLKHLTIAKKHKTDYFYSHRRFCF